MSRLRGGPEAGADAILALLDPDADKADRYDGATLVALFFRDIHMVRNVMASLAGVDPNTDYDP